MNVVYADPTRCPGCRSHLGDDSSRCRTCGLGLTGADATELFGHFVAADRLLGRMRAVSAAPRAAYPQNDVEPGGLSVVSEQPGAMAAESVRGPRRGLSSASVPAILLSLGALCLLVAAVVFLAVAWNILGVGGRTVVLLAFTGAALGLALWLERRGLRWAAEALTVVGHGLLLLDVLGAANAGWLGDLDGSGQAVAWGVVLGVASLALTHLSGRDGTPLVSTQVIAVVAACGLGAGLAGVLDSAAVGALAATVTLGALLVLGRSRGWAILPPLAGLVALPWWATLALSGVDRVVSDASIDALWLHAQAWPLVAAAALLALACWALRQHASAWGFLGGGALALLAGVLVAPGLDESFDRATVLPLIVAVAAIALIRWAPTPWRDTGLVPFVAAIAMPSFAALAAGLVRLGTAIGRPTWESAATDRHWVDGDVIIHPWLIPAVTLVLVAGIAVVVLTWIDRPQPLLDRVLPLGAALIGLAVVAAVASYRLPQVVLVVVALAFAVGLVAAPRLLSAHRLTSYAGATALGLAATLLALPSVGLTLLVGLVLTAVGATIALTETDEAAVRFGEAVTPVGLATATVAGVELIGLAPDWRGVVTLLVLAPLVIWRPTWTVLIFTALAGATAAMSGVEVAAAPGDPSAPLVLALSLTIAGAAYVATALVHEDRRWLAAVGGLLLAAATWVRLAEMDVDVVEAYTLPSALVLVALGVWHLRRHPEATTRFALLPGLVLATVPSLLRTFVEEPLTWRSLLLGLACVGLILAGVGLRWAAPLIVGAAVGTVLVLRVCGPYTADLPPWVVIAGAGTIFTIIGITWEQRLREVRAAGAYLARLR